MTTDQDMLAELDEDPVFADAWIPQDEGDTIIGQITQISSRDTEYGTYTIITILPDGEDTPLAVHCTGTILASHIDADQPAVGDRYAIRYAGERQSKNGRTYRDWRTAIRRGPHIAADPTPPPKKSATTRAKKTAPEPEPTVDADGITF